MTTSAERPEVGTIFRDARGEWVVYGHSSASGVETNLQVRRGSLAHEVMAQRDPRLHAALPPSGQVPPRGNGQGAA